MLRLKKPSLIDDWKKAYRLISVKLAGTGAAVATAWLLMPESYQIHALEAVGLRGAGAAALVMFAAIIFGRVLKQDLAPAPAPEPEPEPELTPVETATMSLTPLRLSKAHDDVELMP